MRRRRAYDKSLMRSLNRRRAKVSKRARYRKASELLDPEKGNLRGSFEGMCTSAKRADVKKGWFKLKAKRLKGAMREMEQTFDVTADGIFYLHIIKSNGDVWDYDVDDGYWVDWKNERV